MRKRRSPGRPPQSAISWKRRKKAGRRDEELQKGVVAPAAERGCSEPGKAKARLARCVNSGVPREASREGDTFPALAASAILDYEPRAESEREQGQPRVCSGS